MNLTHIDNNFYHLTARQAKEICMENVLPKYGHQRKADPAKLVNVTLGKINFNSNPKGTWEKFYSNPPTCAWIQRTPLSWWQGKTIKTNWVWALHVVS